MNLDKIAKQLRRDIAANPKKGAALAVMVLVALYFWGPLVWKFASAGGGSRGKKADMTALILTDDPIEAASQPGKARGTAKFRWERARQLIRADERMASAEFDVTWVDPFARTIEPISPLGSTDVESPVDEAAIAAAAAAAAAVDPSELGIVLGGVMIGPRSRVATINGKSCREGDLISVPDKTEKDVNHEFHVLRINRQLVQLEQSGRIFSLELVPPKLGSGDEFEHGKSRLKN